MEIETKSVINIYNKSSENILVNIDAGVFYYEEIKPEDVLKIIVKGEKDVYKDFCEIHYFEKQVTVSMDFNLSLKLRNIPLFLANLLTSVPR